MGELLFIDTEDWIYSFSCLLRLFYLLRKKLLLILDGRFFLNNIEWPPFPSECRFHNILGVKSGTLELLLLMLLDQLLRMLNIRLWLNTVHL